MYRYLHKAGELSKLAVAAQLIALVATALLLVPRCRNSYFACGLVLAGNFLCRRMLHLASFSAFLKIPEVLRPAAAATRLASRCVAVASLRVGWSAAQRPSLGVYACK